MKIKYGDFLEATVGNSKEESLPELELYSATIFGLGFLDILNRFTNKVGIHINIEQLRETPNEISVSFLVEINRMMIRKKYEVQDGNYIEPFHYIKLGEELEIEI